MYLKQMTYGIIIPTSILNFTFDRRWHFFVVDLL